MERVVTAEGVLDELEVAEPVRSGGGGVGLLPVHKAAERQVEVSHDLHRQQEEDVLREGVRGTHPVGSRTHYHHPQVPTL